MYTSKHYTCEQIDERLLQGYYDDAVEAGYNGTLEQFQEDLLAALGISANGLDAGEVNILPGTGLEASKLQAALAEIVTNSNRTNQALGETVQALNETNQTLNETQQTLNETNQTLNETNQSLQENIQQTTALGESIILGHDDQGNDVKPSDVQSAMPTKEFMEVKMDSQGNLLWLMDKNGHTRFYLPVTFESETHGVKDDRLEGYYAIASKEWKLLVLDAENNIIFGIKTNGEVIASTMDANLATATIKAIEDGIKKEYDGVISDLKAEASDPLDKYVSLSSGISDADIRNGTSKYDEIAKKSSNPNMTKQACSVLYNLMKLEKDNRFIAPFYLDIDWRSQFHKQGFSIEVIREGQPVTINYTNYHDQFRNENNGVYTPKEPTDDTFVFDPLSRHAYYYDGNNQEVIIPIGNRTPVMFMYDFRPITEHRGYTPTQIAENKAIFLTLIKKGWVDYKAIPMFFWNESNPYAPWQRSKRDGKQEGEPDNTQYFVLSGYNYTYDDEGYPIPSEYPYVVADGSYTILDESFSHRYVLKEILDEVEYGTDDGENYPSVNNTICGFYKDNAETKKGVYTAPYLWFDNQCQEIGQFIREIYAFINDMTLQEWDALSSAEKRELEIPIIIRPWQECEDSWGWWGAPMCTPDEYKRFFKLTVEKINHYSDSNSILYGYCTDHNFSTPQVNGFMEYDTRYPGDDAVDIVGFDDYSMGRPNYLQEGLSKIKLVSSFAKSHGKPAFIWECGNTDVDAGWYNTWISVFQTAGVNFAGWLGFMSAYPTYITNNQTKLAEQFADYKQYYNRSNMPCAEDDFDLTTITE